VIHNPHFYEFQRNNSQVVRNAADIPCGGFPHINELREFMTREVIKGEIVMFLNSVHRQVIHIERHVLGWEINAQPPDNAILRVSYLLDELSEDGFKKKLQTRDKDHHKQMDWGAVYTMYANVMSDLFRQMILKVITLNEFVETHERLVAYANTEFVNISKRYKCVRKVIS